MLTRMKARTKTTTAETVIKPVLTATFKSSKIRTTPRTIVSEKKRVSSANFSIQETEVEMLDVSTGSLSPASSSNMSLDSTETTMVKTRRTTRSTRASTLATAIVAHKEEQPATIVQDITVQVTAEKKVTKHPEEDPWKKRPMITPSYAAKALVHLTKVDPALGTVMKNIPFQVYAEKDTNYFRVLTRTIVGQQVHWKAARSILLKFVSFYYPSTTMDAIDHGFYDFPTPQRVLATSMADLRSCGLSERKASYIQDLAQHFADGRITFQKPGVLSTLTDKEIADQLLCVRGIGPWTVDMFLMFQLERLDILPTLDLGVRKGMEMHFKNEYSNGVWGTLADDDEEEEEQEGEQESGSKEKTSKGGKTSKKKMTEKKKAVFKGKGTKKGEMTIQDMERMAERWRPYRSIGAWYMWRVLDDKITASI